LREIVASSREISATHISVFIIINISFGYSL